MTFYGLFWAAGGNDIIAIKLHLSINQITYFMRVAVFVGPVIAFFITRRWCISLQRHGQRRRCCTATRPASSCARPRAATPSGTCRSARTAPTRSPPATATRCSTPGPRRRRATASPPRAPVALDKLRAPAVARCWYADNIQKPTAEELEEAHHHAEHEHELQAGLDHPADGHQFDDHALRDADDVPLRGAHDETAAAGTGSGGSGGHHDDADDAARPVADRATSTAATRSGRRPSLVGVGRVAVRPVRGSVGSRAAWHRFRGPRRRQAPTAHPGRRRRAARTCYESAEPLAYCREGLVPVAVAVGRAPSGGRCRCTRRRHRAWSCRRASRRWRCSCRCSRGRRWRSPGSRPTTGRRGGTHRSRSPAWRTRRRRCRSRPALFGAMPTVSEFIRLCRNFSMITLMPERVVKPGLAGGDRDRAQQLAVAEDLHLVGLRVDLVDDRVADVEVDVAVLLAVDAVAGRRRC